MPLKVKSYFDITCDLCTRSLSTDFDRGFATTKTNAQKWAKEAGFVNLSGRNICPVCIKNLNIKADKQKGNNNE